jgi:hypothetical protein
MFFPSFYAFEIALIIGAIFIKFGLAPAIRSIFIIIYSTLVKNNGIFLFND